MRGGRDGNDGKTAHVGATRELKAAASEIQRAVRGDGWQEPAAVHRRWAAAGELDQRQYGAGYSTAWYGVGRTDTARWGGEAPA